MQGARSEPYAILAHEEVFGMIAECDGLVEALDLETGPLEAAMALNCGSLAPAGATA